MTRIRVGDIVRIERDETRYPSKGTWPQFRGRVGTVVEINLGEYGVVFTKVTPRTDGRGRFNHGGIVTWFQPYELTISEHSGKPSPEPSGPRTRVRAPSGHPRGDSDG